MKRKGNTLKYGYKAPLLDYYKFNCSRQYDVRTIFYLYSYFVVVNVMIIRTGAMTELN